MPFYVYILYPASLGQYYTDHKENLQDKIFRHKNPDCKSTKKVNAFKTVKIFIHRFIELTLHIKN
jgi:predicted GIY-YIG superfamily endonuclease